MDSILDMPLDWKDMKGKEISPLHMLVIMKGIDKEGFEVDTVMHTEGLSLSNALGLARFGVLYVEDEVRKTLYEKELHGELIDSEEE